jgi:ATP-dependent RNA helicase DDX27
LESLQQFKDGKASFLLATDLASRGLDIQGIKTVINYDMPKSYSHYIHRVGRTARGNQSGTAISFVSESDRPILKSALKGASKDKDSVIRQRSVPLAVVEQIERELKGLEDAVKEIYEEEKMDKEMRVAEMKVEKMENMMKYADEIKGRPARTWFQSNKEKEAAKGNIKFFFSRKVSLN